MYTVDEQMRASPIHSPETASKLAVSGEISDEAIVERVRGGEIALYELLMRRYNQRLYRVAFSILRNDSEAEDVMQDAYVRAYQHLDQFAGEAKFSTWLTKIAVYEALARLRIRDRTEDLDAMLETNAHIMAHVTNSMRDPETQAYDQELRVVMERAVNALPTTFRAVFMLRAVEGLNVAETAECLGVSLETVKTRLHRARSLLRKDLFRLAGVTAVQAFPFHLSRCDRIVEGVFRKISSEA